MPQATLCPPAAEAQNWGRKLLDLEVGQVHTVISKNWLRKSAMRLHKGSIAFDLIAMHNHVKL
jgi:hypothetical protein